ncbi:pH-response regulator protein palH/RIM21 [[Candida] zeylanoides]
MQPQHHRPRSRSRIRGQSRRCGRSRCSQLCRQLLLLLLLAPAAADSLMQWRHTLDDTTYSSCQPLELPPGLLISLYETRATAEFIDRASYQQSCYLGRTPMLNTNVGYLMEQYARPLPLMRQSWHRWTHSNYGSFAYSVVPVFYSISVSAVVTWFLTIFVLTNYTIKASLLLRASTILSSAYLLVTVVLAFIKLDQQQRRGYLHGAELLDYINANRALNILDLVVMMLLQVNQAQVIMRIFSRQSDKRMTLLIGVAFTLTSQVIWAVAQFHSFGRDNEAGDILPAFIYLVRIAMGATYAALITVYICTKAHLVWRNRSIWLLTLLTLVLIYSPVAFFIADVSNIWVSELSDVFSCVTYVICVVIPWEWCNKLNAIMRVREKEGLLGRRFHEDEVYELDRVELFATESGGDADAGGRGSGSGSSVSASSSLNHPPHRLAHLLTKTRSTILNIADLIIATGLAIPRSVSVSTPPFHESAPRAADDAAGEPPGRNRRDVFVYAPKTVHISDAESG